MNEIIILKTFHKMNKSVKNSLRYTIDSTFIFFSFRFEPCTESQSLLTKVGTILNSFRNPRPILYSILDQEKIKSIVEKTSFETF